MYIHQTKKTKSVLTVENNMLCCRSNGKLVFPKVPAEYVFDTLAKSLSVKDPNIGIARRAKQLNGMSVHDAVKI